MKVHSTKLPLGFTLFELVVVILIIGVLAIMVTINWPSTQLSIGAQAEQLATDIRYTQTLSMTQGQRYCLKISGNTYQIFNSSTSTAQLSGLGKTITTLGAGITFGSLSPAGMVLLIFDGLGAPYSSTAAVCTTANVTAATALAAAANIPLSAGGQTKTILVSPETGRVIIQ